MKKQIIVVVFFSALFLSLPLCAQSSSVNPFHRQKGGAHSESISSSSLSLYSTDNAFYSKITEYQKVSNRKISEMILEYRENGSLLFLVSIGLFALLYGFIHAMMPGHGKNIISAWILSGSHGIKKLIYTASLGMFFHVFTAVSVIFLIYFIIQGRISTYSTLFVRYFSFSAIALISLLALITFIKGVRRFILVHRDNSHSHGLEKISAESSWRECTVVSLTMGLVPCPVSSILTVYMLSKGLVWEALFMALFFGMGMGVTVLGFSLLFWIFKSSLVKVRKHQQYHYIDLLLHIVSALLLLFSASVIAVVYI